MKQSHIFFTFCIIFCLVSCSKNGDEPYRPTEWQYDRYSNPAILPGDDFYRFTCGKGIADGSDNWAPIPVWIKQERDYLNIAFSDGDSNPVPVFGRLNELKKGISSEERKSEAFANMRKRLDGITERTKDMGFPEKAAEYCRSGYTVFLVHPILLSGHKFGFYATAVYLGLLQDWSLEQLKLAGIYDEYSRLLPKARKFEKYLLDNIKDDEFSIESLDAGICKDCRQLKEYVESFARTKASGSAFERFTSALGNKNPDFVPSGNATKQYFELVDKMEDAEMKEAADAFLWCVAVSFDMSIILDPQSQINFLLTVLYPNLIMNMSHTFCDTYVNPECGKRNKEIFEVLRKAMAGRLEQSDWLSPYTKASAKRKIDAMECHTGILDWSRYEADMPVSEDFCSALHEVGSSNISKLMAFSGENSNLDHIIAISYMMPLIGTPAYSANSFYLQNANAMCILPSSYLLMDMNREFPFITFVIAHEICHGFDANGANFNERGEFGDWWSIDDKIVFKKKQDQLIGIFNQYYVGETIFCNGAKTIEEDMADLGGLEITYYAMAGKLEEKFRGDELMEMKRRLFKSYAIFYAQNISLDEKINQVKEDVHSINEYRVNGIVNNIDDWYRLFDVTCERKFYLSPENRVVLW